MYLQVAEYVYPTDVTPEYSSILVPNVDNARTDYLLNAISKQSKVSVSTFHSLLLKIVLCLYKDLQRFTAALEQFVYYLFWFMRATLYCIPYHFITTER